MLGRSQWSSSNLASYWLMDLYMYMSQREGGTWTCTNYNQMTRCQTRVATAVATRQHGWLEAGLGETCGHIPQRCPVCHWPSPPTLVFSVDGATASENCLSRPFCDGRESPQQSSEGVVAQRNYCEGSYTCQGMCSVGSLYARSYTPVNSTLSCCCAQLLSKWQK